MRWHLPIKAFAISLLTAGSLSAQQPAAPDPPVLHVYVNLMQIPVLLLDQYHRPLPPIEPSRFRVTIEGLQTFTPYRVRRQGEDPISLAILVDSSEADEILWDHLADASRELAANLRPHDRVEVYGMDGCKLRRYLNESAFNAETLHNGLANAAAVKPYVLEHKKVGPCAAPISFWDALFYVAATLEQRNGRRVVLALSNGRQALPPETGTRLHMLLNANSTTLFGIQHSESDGGYFATGSDMFGSARSQGRGRGSAGLDANLGPPLLVQSEMSGGMLMGASIHSLPKVLGRTLELARGRYIVEFPRPAQLDAGQHSISVSAGNPRHFIRPAGISVPPASKDERTIDLTVQHGVSDPQLTREDASSMQTQASPSPAAGAPRSAAPMAAPAQRAPAPLQTNATTRTAADPLDITNEVQPAAPARP